MYRKCWNNFTTSRHLVRLVKLSQVEVQWPDFDHVFFGDLIGKVCGRQVLNEPRLPLGLGRGNISVWWSMVPTNFNNHNYDCYSNLSGLRNCRSTLVATATFFLSAQAIHSCPTVHPSLAAISFRTGSSRTENRSYFSVRWALYWYMPIGYQILTHCSSVRTHPSCSPHELPFLCHSRWESRPVRLCHVPRKSSRCPRHSSTGWTQSGSGPASPCTCKWFATWPRFLSTHYFTFSVVHFKRFSIK